MKFLRALLLSLALTAPASAADYVAGTPSAGQTQGTATNDNACAGCVGELLFADVPAETATITWTSAAPGIASWTTHGLVAGSAVYFTAGTSVPTGLTASTTYYVCGGATLLTSSFAVATTVVNAFAGTCITTSSTGTGTQTGVAGAYLGTGVAANVGALNVTPGDWTCYGAVVFTAGSGTSVTGLETVIGTAASPSGSSTHLNAATFAQATFLTSGTEIVSAGVMRVSASTATPVYLSALANFGTSTMVPTGTLSCRRAR